MQPAAKLYMIYQTEELLEEVKTNMDDKGTDRIKLVGKVEHSNCKTGITLPILLFPVHIMKVVALRFVKLCHVDVYRWLQILFPFEK